MSTYNNRASNPTANRDYNREGAEAWRPNPPLELLFTAVNTLAEEDTFYESAETRMDRLVTLVRNVSVSHPKQVLRLIRDMPEKYGLRTATLVVAAEYGFAVGGGSSAYHAIDLACRRPDQPAELLAYWFEKHGRKVPSFIRAGLGIAARRLYTERSVIKWDRDGARVRMADVLRVCHVKAKDETQNELFRYILSGRRPNQEIRFNPQVLPILGKQRELWTMPEAMRSAVPDEMLQAAGMSWEQVTAWLPGEMTNRKWERVLTLMGIKGLVMNLRNFDAAGISDEAAEYVISRITDPGVVSGAGLLPHQVYAAYRALTADTYTHALSKTLNLVTEASTPLHGALVLVDVSRSMQHPVSARSKITLREVATLQALTFYHASKGDDSCDLALFATSSILVTLPKGTSVLRAMNGLADVDLGGGTNGCSAIVRHFDPERHSRVFIFTDDQMRDTQVDVSHVPYIVTFQVGGYAPASTWGKGRFHVPGFSSSVSDAMAKVTDGLF